MKTVRPWTGLLADLVEVRADEHQVAQYVAVLSGVRRSLDDWIALPRLEGYERFAGRVGLHVEIDCVFRPLEGGSEVAGIDIVPTTRASGAAYRRAMTGGPSDRAHVVVSRRADWAAEACAAAWYSVEVGGRIVRKPLVDHLRFGRALGYPDCCCRFFADNNDWPRLSSLCEALRRTERLRWEANCLPKHTPWMCVFHIPCRFDCPSTCEQTASILEAVREVDASYAVEIAAAARQPFLAFSEVTSYALFGGVVDGAKASYERALYVGGDPRHDRHGALLAEGNELELEDGAVFVLRDGRVRGVIRARCEPGRVEAPLLLAFG